MTGQGLWEGQRPSSSCDLERKLLIGFFLVKGRRGNWNQPFWIINELPKHGPNSSFLHIQVHFSFGFLKTSPLAIYTWKETVNSFKTTGSTSRQELVLYMTDCVTCNNINVMHTFKHTYVCVYVCVCACMCVYSCYGNYCKWVKDAINCLCYHYVFVSTHWCRMWFSSLWITPRTERALRLFSMRNLALKKETFRSLIL